MKNCKLCFVFPNILKLYILGLRATKMLIRSICSKVIYAMFKRYTNANLKISPYVCSYKNNILIISHSQY